MVAGVTYFGRYEIRSLVGSGGMGEVFEAFDREQNRLVALKLLPVPLAADEGFVERFRRESFAAAQLSDPHVIPIHRYGDIDGRLYIDMRLVRGLDLAALLERDGPLPAARAVSFIGQAAEALDAAHAANLIHRDVKPSNLLVTPQDFVYLVDFGIAHVFGLGTAGRALTATGATIGTLDYMAPERFLGRTEVDSRTDVYSLTCVLYECLTGKRPFPVDGLPALLHAHLNTAPPGVSVERADLPVALDQVIARGMAKDPDQRYASAGELAREATKAIHGVALGGGAPGAGSVTGPTGLEVSSTTPVASGPPGGRTSAPFSQPTFLSPNEGGTVPPGQAGTVPPRVWESMSPGQGTSPPSTYIAPGAGWAASRGIPTGPVGGGAAPSHLLRPDSHLPAPTSGKRHAGWLIAAAVVVVLVVSGAIIVARLGFESRTVADPQSASPSPVSAGSVPSNSTASSAQSTAPSAGSASSRPAPPVPATQTVVVTSVVQSTAPVPPPAPTTTLARQSDVPAADRAGDLGLTTQIANLGCTGQYVTLVGSSVDPSLYRSEVQGFLGAYPASSYLLTAQSCGSFVSSVNGNSVYAAYLGPFGSQSQACAARDSIGGNSYVKVLNNIAPDEAAVEC